MLYFLIRRSRGLVAAAALFSVAAGLCSVWLVTLINTAITVDAAARTALAWRFAGVVVGVLMFSIAANVLFQILRQKAAADLRAKVAECVMDAPFRHLERTGAGKVQSALADHAIHVAQFFVSLPGVLTNGVIVVGCMVYLASLSWYVFLAGVGVLLCGSIGYCYAYAKAIDHLHRASEMQDQLFGNFRSLTDGAKELRQNRGKRTRFAVEVMNRAIRQVSHQRVIGMSIFEAAVGWGSFLIYAFIGLVLFVLATDAPDQTRVITGFALIFIYMISPLQSLLNSLPEANIARVASHRIDELTASMAGTEQAAPEGGATAFQRIDLHAVKHRYYHEKSGEFFELGPIDLSFRPGELVFLVGGNGSGKTTLAKLLVGLYPQDSGEVLLDGQPVDDRNRDAYRQLFSTVFSDFHLFDKLLEASTVLSDDIGNRYLEKLHLHHKVQIRDGAFSTRELSQGQRKRLALVVAYLEDRPFLVFDEWAADQDPVFKRFFYQEVLPELRARGKAVLVISHDDRYFHGADRLIRLEEGRIVAQDASRPQPTAEVEAGRAMAAPFAGSPA
ncbi:cyclic peptide export ABC transporter [Acidovorax sp. NCPPB 2350]|nr:cyclic peptide export ABC transporter [Acidovorax sp. NCPPB 2350]